jgi:RNA polymerase sigma-70 factor (ECF subfamily)
MVAAQLDDRLAARFDPSDVVQEALAEASRRLDDYLTRRPVAFYPWLRGLAVDRLTDLKRRHLADKRSVRREEPGQHRSDRSGFALAEQLVASISSPSKLHRQQEQQDRVRAALDGLSQDERQILLLRYVEDCSTAEIADLLDVSERTVRRGHRQALDRLSRLLKEHDASSEE